MCLFLLVHYLEKLSELDSAIPVLIYLIYQVLDL
jgi:hypothetical protein